MKNLSKYQFKKKIIANIKKSIQTIFTDDESKLSVEKCFKLFKRKLPKKE